MKILHLITSMNKGGAETTLFKILKFSKETNSKNKHIIISFSKLNYYENDIKKFNYQFIKIDFKNKIFFIIYFFKLIKVIKSIKPDIIECWMYHSALIGGIASKVIGIKKIIWNIRHSNYKFNKTKLLTIIIIKLLAILSKFIPDIIVYCSKNSLKFHQSIGYRTKIQKIIYNGYYKDYFKRIPKKSNFENNKTVTFGFIGRYSPQKNVGMYLEAFSLFLKKYSFNLKIKIIMYGRDLDNNNSELVNKIKKYKLSSFVVLGGYAKDVRIAFENIDFLCLSSSYGESFPNILAEAMLSGIPCLATDVGESKNILSKYGKTVEVNDTIGFSAKIEEFFYIYKNKNKYETLSKSCRKHIENNYSIQIMYKKYHYLWNNTNV